MSESWEDSEPLPMGMVSDASRKSTQSVKSVKSEKSAKSEKSDKSAKSSASSKSKKSSAKSSEKSSSKSGESSKGSHSEHDEPSSTSEQSSSSTTAKLSKRPDLDGIVGKKKIAVSPERAARPNIQIALSGSKLVYTSEDAWRDASDQVELQAAIHPVLAENINLKKRAELLVRLVAESQYENQQLEAEMKECDEVIKELRRTLGEKIEEEEEEERHEEERDEETGTSF